MSKRRLSQNQSRRILSTLEKKQASKSDFPEHNGLVITTLKRKVLLEDHEQKTYLCSIPAKIFSIVPGDNVIWHPINDTQGAIINVLPRKNLLERPDKRNQLKPVAANISQLVVVVAPKPEISWSLIDSYLVLAEHLDITPLIVLNKIDMNDDISKSLLKIIYEQIGYDVIFVSTLQSETLSPLLSKLNEQTSIIVGQSGVGKSSIIRQILPQEKIVTQELSEGTDLGKHTTSNAKLYHLPEGGILIDSPGVREFGLGHVTKEIITKGYREFRPYLAKCKFRNCNHLTDPHCGLPIGILEGKIHPQRLHNYQKLIQQHAENG